MLFQLGGLASAQQVSESEIQPTIRFFRSAVVRENSKTVLGPAGQTTVADRVRGEWMLFSRYPVRGDSVTTVRGCSSCRSKCQCC